MGINSPSRSNEAEFQIGSLVEITPKIRKDAGILSSKKESYVKSIEIISPTKYKVEYIFHENMVDMTAKQTAIEQGLLMSFRIYAKNNPGKLPFTLEKYVNARKYADYTRDNRYFGKNEKIVPGKETYAVIEITDIRRRYTHPNKEPFFIASFTLKGNPDQENVFVSGEVKCILMEKHLK